LGVGGVARQFITKTIYYAGKGIPATRFLGQPSNNREKQQQLTTDDGETVAKYLRGERNDKINNNIIKD